MRKDSRGRVRFTVNHVRYEINKEGVLRAYRRGYDVHETERAMPVSVKALDYPSMLAQAVMTARNS